MMQSDSYQPRHQHGGQLRQASDQYGVPLSDWLDLSTGISPVVYPLPDMPTRCWQRLPEAQDGLEQAASLYYGSDHLLAVSGSQEAIQRLPWLRPVSRVGIISPAYHSHYQAWCKAGHEVLELGAHEVESQLAHLDVLLVVNPVNPTAERFEVQQLLRWHQQLQARGGWLVVDEAFMDSKPEQSVIEFEPQGGLIVLRSLGKFFGLAGVRLGFVWAEASLLSQLAERQDDWSVSHPARWAGRQALADRGWQGRQRQVLHLLGQRLELLLLQTWPEATVRNADLFVYCAMPNAEAEFERLAQLGILVRQFHTPAALRFGLPATEADWQRLQQALQLGK